MSKELTIGTKMPDGTIYAGISPDTKVPMYAAPTDESLLMTFNDASRRAEELSKTTGNAYRIPSASELNVLFNNRAAIGGFNETGDYVGGWYWSSSEYSADCSNDSARVQRFNDGKQSFVYKVFVYSSVRLVRS